MDKCCGVVCDTPFCPYCGRVVINTGLGGLLRHIRAQTKAKQVALDTMKNALESTGKPQSIGRVVRLERVVAKWTLWGDELERLLARDSAERANSCKS